jgi:2,3,4,5-tetrahydropyridine-2,6-dicarboxylate N-succinyltransferase
MNQTLEQTINDAWEARDDISSSTQGPVREAVDLALENLDRGEMRVANKKNSSWQVNQWLKKAVLLSFRLNDMTPIAGGPGPDGTWFDKVASKFDGWDTQRFAAAGFRAVPIVLSGAQPISEKALF